MRGTAVILAGGHSRRMGRDKAAVKLAGVALLQWVIDRVASEVAEIIVVRRSAQALPPISGSKVRFTDDIYEEKGPLGGLHAGLTEVRAWPVLALGCDASLLEPRLLRRLLELAESFDAVVPVCDGSKQCLCAAYGQACLETITERLERNELRVADFLDDVRRHYLSEEEWRQFDPEGRSFLNVNDACALRRAEAALI